MGYVRGDLLVYEEQRFRRFAEIAQQSYRLKQESLRKSGANYRTISNQRDQAMKAVSTYKYFSHAALGHLTYFKTDSKNGPGYLVGEVDETHIESQRMPYKSIESFYSYRGPRARWAFEFRLSSRLVLKGRFTANGTADQSMLALLDQQEPVKNGSLNITGIAYHTQARGYNQIQEELREHQTARRDPNAAHPDWVRDHRQEMDNQREMANLAASRNSVAPSNLRR